MKAASECLPCLRRLVHQAATLATNDEALRAQALDEGLAIVEGRFSYQGTTIGLATALHEAVKTVTGNPDPYRGMKDQEMALARGLIATVASQYAPDFEGGLALAALGNSIDFFKDADAIEADLERGVRFTIDHSRRFEERCRGAGQVLFLADNAGEVFFDLPLVRWLSGVTSVTYVVKGAPVQNDITMADLELSGLADEMGALARIATTGTATPGVLLDLASEEFLALFRSADVVLAKGMGYYESLSELEGDGRVLHVLKAKCLPVARSLGVPLDSYVAFFDLGIGCEGSKKCVSAMWGHYLTCISWLT